MQINIEKKHVYILGILLLLIIGSFVFAGAANYLTGAAVSSGANDADAFGHDLVCVTGRMFQGNTLEFIGATSTEWNNGNIGNVVEKFMDDNIPANIIRCKEGWTMTGCSGATSGTQDNDMRMYINNGCQEEETSGVTDKTVYIRCCQIG